MGKNPNAKLQNTLFCDSDIFAKLICNYCSTIEKTIFIQDKLAR